jgi:phosphatidylserine decarboxylase
VETIKNWLSRPDIKELQNSTTGRNMEQPFFRDPMRHICMDPNLVYSPADGVVLYALPEVKPDDFLEIKGRQFTLAEMLALPKFTEKCLVVGIFMTSFDVHINRIPANAYYLEERPTNDLYTHNVSMLLAENDLFNDLGYKKDHLTYLYANERKVSTFYCPRIKGRYYIVQVGDRDIDVILNWGVDGPVFQGERFGEIRWGSQVDVLIPLTGKVQFKLMVKKLDHIEAGIDPIAQITGGE